jgi:pimeloyl-ACP methyl ester carboxylesterase
MPDWAALRGRLSAALGGEPGVDIGTPAADGLNLQIPVADGFAPGQTAIQAPLARALDAIASQDLTRRSALLILRGDDTLVVERVERTASRVRAEIAGTGLPRIVLVYDLGADHLVRKTTLEVFAPNATADAAAIQTGTVEFTGDSAIMVFHAGGGTRTIRVATPPGTLPIVNNDFVVAEQAARRMRAAGDSVMTVPMFALSAGQVVPGKIERLGGDSLRFSIAQSVTILHVDAQGHVTSGAIPAASLRIVGLEGAAAARVRASPPDYAAPVGAPYAAEEVRVLTPTGHTLAGTLTIPQAVAGRLPAVVTITGSGPQDRDEFVNIADGYRLFREVADTLGRRGIAVLRLDDRGVGGSGGDAAGTSADFADDIRAAVAYLRGRAEIDPARIALVGHSEGGMIAPMVAAEDPRLAGIALLAGTAYTGRQIIEYQRANGARASSLPADSVVALLAAAKAEFDSTAARAPWMRFFLEYDPVPTARRVTQPALILQGETDQQVRPEEARMLAAAMREAGNQQVTLRIFPEQNHFFVHDPDGHPSGYARLTDARVDREMLGTLTDWLATTLRASR